MYRVIGVQQNLYDLTLDNLHAELSNLKPTLPTPFKPVILDFPLSNPSIV